ncbi:MAG: hypothetical protein WDZ73_00920 [Candidatus Paceibacterota bacterium]
MKEKINKYFKIIMAKSETERRQIALLTSVGLTLLIIFVWVANGFIINKISEREGLQVVAVVAEDKEPSFLARETKRVADGLQVVGDYLKQLF